MRNKIMLTKAEVKGWSHCDITYNMEFIVILISTSHDNLTVTLHYLDDLPPTFLVLSAVEVFLHRTERQIVETLCLRRQANLHREEGGMNEQNIFTSQ